MWVSDVKVSQKHCEQWLLLRDVCLYEPGYKCDILKMWTMWSRSVMSGSANPWTVVHQAPPSMGFSRQEYWSGLPFPSPGDLPDPEIEPVSRIAGRHFNLWATREALVGDNNQRYFGSYTGCTQEKLPSLAGSGGGSHSFIQQHLH